MKWYEIFFYTLALLGFIIRILVWYRVPPPNLRRFIHKVRGLLKLNISFIIGLAIILVSISGLASIILEIIQEEPIFEILMKFVVIIVGLFGLISLMTTFRKYK